MWKGLCGSGGSARGSELWLGGWGCGLRGFCCHMSLSGGLFVPGPACLFSLFLRELPHTSMPHTEDRQDELQPWEVKGQNDKKRQKHCFRYWLRTMDASLRMLITSYCVLMVSAKNTHTHTVYTPIYFLTYSTYCNCACLQFRDSSWYVGLFTSFLTSWPPLSWSKLCSSRAAVLPGLSMRLSITLRG